jgi:hypothetical protein
MTKTDQITTNLTIDEIFVKVKTMANKYNFFLLEKEGRLILKREIIYSNGTSTVIQKYTVLPLIKEGITEVIISLEIESNFINKTIEKMYVTDSNTVKAINSFKNVLNKILDDDMPLSEDEHNISGAEAPTSNGLKLFIYVVIIFVIALFLITMEKSCK